MAKNARAWVIADTHFGHSRILQFKSPDGQPTRPFADVNEMDEFMVERWNSVVAEKDRVYVLGDFAMRRQSVAIAERLNGRKVLIKGNHDIYQLKDYVPYFDDIRGCVVKKSAILTHIPVHEQQLERFQNNIHGHLHTQTLPDERYICVSAEQVNYTPVRLDIILSQYLSS